MNSCNYNFFYSFFYNFFNFVYYTLWFPTSYSALCIRNYAIWAKIVTTILNFYNCSCFFCVCNCSKVLEFFFFFNWFYFFLLFIWIVFYYLNNISLICISELLYLVLLPFQVQLYLLLHSNLLQLQLSFRYGFWLVL